MTPTFPASLGLDVSRETMDRFALYLDMLRKWNPKINLVGAATLTDAWTRHFVDSAQVFASAPKDWVHWVDIGSGGGFPGMVVAILAKSFCPECRVTLIEADQRKAAFLRAVGRETGTPVEVLSDRIERVTPQQADVVSARALAPLSKLLGYVSRHCHPEGTALLLKGAQAQSELSEARKNWHFYLEESPSLTDPEAVILKLRELRGA